MGQLTNQFVSSSYQGLLNLENANTGVTATLQYVTDGLGNKLPMLASTSSIVITGSFRGDGSGLSGITVDSGSLVTTASFNAFTSSIDNRVDSLEQETGSLQLQINQKLDTGSFNSYTGSNDSKVNSLIAATGSYATTSSLTTLSGSIATTDLAQNNRLTSIEGITGSLATTSSLTALSSSIATTDLAQNNRLNSIETTTGSLQLQINQKLNTGSFNAYTSSNDAKVNDLISKTGSYVTETESGSFVTSVTGVSDTITVTKGNGTTNNVTVNNVNNSVSSSYSNYAVTASFALNAPSINTGSFLTQAYITGGTTNLSLITTQGDGLVLVSNVQTVPSASLAQTAVSSSFATNAGSAISSSFANLAQNAISSSMALSADYAVTSSFSTNAVSSSQAQNAVTASYALNAVSSSQAENAVSSSFAQTAISSSFATNAATASIANDVIVRCKNDAITTLTRGTVVRIIGANGDNPLINVASWEDDANSANTLGMLSEDVAPNGFANVVVQGTVIGIDTNGMPAGALLFLSSSGQYTTSSVPAPYHEVRLGQVLRDNTNNGSAYISIDNGYELNELHDVDITSVQAGDLLVYVTGSYGQWVNKDAGEIGLATTGSNVFQGNQTISGSLNVTGTVYATSASFTYVTSSQIVVTGNTIAVNIAEPAQRFGGLVAYDSGSSSATASLLWDSQENHWIYANVSGAAYAGGGLISGPRNTGSLGDETYPTLNTITRGQGGDHIYDSNITDDDSVITMKIKTDVSGSLSVTGGITGSLQGNASTATSASHAVQAISSSHALNSDTAISSSQAQNAVSSSHSINSDTAISSSFAQNAVSSSFATNAGTAISSSFATNADTAVSSSYAQNADTAVSSSFASTAISSSFAQTSISSSQAQTAVSSSYSDFAVSSSLAQNAISSSFSDFAVSSSQAQNAVSSSHSVNSDTSVSSSFAQTAVSSSFATDAGSAISSSFAQTSISSSQAQNAVSSSYSDFAVSSSLAQNSITSSYSDYAVSSSQAQNSITSSFSDFAVSSSQAENAVSASWAPTPDVSYLATTGSNNFFGTENITGSLNVSGSATFREGNMFFDLPHGTSGFNYITASNTGNGNLIFSAQNAATSVSQSLQLSGSNNFIFGRPSVNQPQYLNRIPSGSYANFVLLTPAMSTSSLAPIPIYRGNINLGTQQDRYLYSTSSAAGVTPSITNNYIGGTLQLNTFLQYRPMSVTNNNIVGTLTVSTTAAESYNTGITSTQQVASNIVAGALTVTNSGTGSYTTISNNNINSTTVSVTNAWNALPGASSHNFQNNSIGGGSHTFNIQGSASKNSMIRANVSNLIGGNNTSLRSPNDSNDSGSLYNSLIFGSNLIVTSSHYDSTGSLGIQLSNPSSTIMLGSYNEGGLLADTTQTKFALGTGTAAGSRRTSLYVSSSGQFHVRSGMVQSGSLELVSNSTSGSMNLTGSLNVTGTLQVKGGGLVVSGGQAQFNNEIVFNGGTYFSQPMENFVKLNAGSTTTLNIDNFNLNTPASQSLWTSTVDTGSNYTQQRTEVTNGGTTGFLNLRNTGGVTTYTIDVEKTVVTGSIQGNVGGLTINSNTASLNLDNGNFFTLQLVEGTDTRIEPSNIKPGQTINLKLNTTGSATVSFPSSVKQPSGSQYVPTTTTGVDIVTLVSFDGSDLYLANVKNLI